jgi:hypothetical protein
MRRKGEGAKLRNDEEKGRKGERAKLRNDEEKRRKGV